MDDETLFSLNVPPPPPAAPPSLPPALRTLRSAASFVGLKNAGKLSKTTSFVSFSGVSEDSDAGHSGGSSAFSKWRAAKKKVGLAAKVMRAFSSTVLNKATIEYATEKELLYTNKNFKLPKIPDILEEPIIPLTKTAEMDPFSLQTENEYQTYPMVTKKKSPLRTNSLVSSPSSDSNNNNRNIGRERIASSRASTAKSQQLVTLRKCFCKEDTHNSEEHITRHGINTGAKPSSYRLERLKQSSMASSMPMLSPTKKVRDDDYVDLDGLKDVFAKARDINMSLVSDVRKVSVKLHGGKAARAKRKKYAEFSHQRRDRLLMTSQQAKLKVIDTDPNVDVNTPLEFAAWHFQNILGDIFVPHLPPAKKSATLPAVLPSMVTSTSALKKLPPDPNYEKLGGSLPKASAVLTEMLDTIKRKKERRLELAKIWQQVVKGKDEEAKKKKKKKKTVDGDAAAAAAATTTTTDALEETNEFVMTQEEQELSIDMEDNPTVRDMLKRANSFSNLLLSSVTQAVTSSSSIQIPATISEDDENSAVLLPSSTNLKLFIPNPPSTPPQKSSSTPRLSKIKSPTASSGSGFFLTSLEIDVNADADGTDPPAIMHVEPPTPSRKPRTPVSRRSSILASTPLIQSPTNASVTSEPFSPDRLKKNLSFSKSFTQKPSRPSSAEKQPSPIMHKKESTIFHEDYYKDVEMFPARVIKLVPVDANGDWIIPMNKPKPVNADSKTFFESQSRFPSTTLSKIREKRLREPQNVLHSQMLLFAAMAQNEFQEISRIEATAKKEMDTLSDKMHEQYSNPVRLFVDNQVMLI